MNVLVYLACLVSFSEFNFVATFALVFFFVLCGCIIFSFGLEFIGLLFIAIYAGALAVLLVFVVLLQGSNVRKTVPVSGFQWCFLFFFVLITNLFLIKCEEDLLAGGGVAVHVEDLRVSFFLEQDLEVFGFLLFEKYGYLVIIIGVFLLMVLFGFIVLTNFSLFAAGYGRG